MFIFNSESIGSLSLRKSYSLLFIIILLFLSCVSGKDDYLRNILMIPAKDYRSYDFDPQTPLVARISETPDFLLNYLRKMDQREDYISYSVSDSEKDMFEEYLLLLPSLNLRVMKEKLIGIYFVENLIGSALADYVLDEEGQIYNILFINPETMRHSMSDWLTYRESTCFSEGKKKVSLSCGEGYTGLLYTLMHESTHIVDYSLSLTPYTEYTSMKASGTGYNKRNLFFDIWDSYSQPVKKYRKEYMEQLSFYGLGNKPPLDVKRADDIYRQLEETPFCSLYGSVSWAEDLAELATWYHYTKVLGMPYEVKIIEGETVKDRFFPMMNPLVQERFSLLGILYE